MNLKISLFKTKIINYKTNLKFIIFLLNKKKIIFNNMNDKLLELNEEEQSSNLSFYNPKKEKNESNEKKKKIFNFEYKQLTKSIQSAKNYIKNDKKIQKNRFLSPQKIIINEQNFSQNYSLMSTSLSTIDFLSKNELISLKFKNEKLKNELSKIDDNIKKTNYNISNLQIQFLKLKAKKDNCQINLENYLSNKESLEEILKIAIHDINNSSLSFKLTDIKINENDIFESDKIKFKEMLISLLENLNIIVLNKMKKRIEEVLDKIYNKIKENKKNDIINNFLNPINDLFYEILFEKIQQENIINILIKLNLKIQVINFNIEQNIKFINKEYKEQKNEIKLKKEDLEKYLLELKRKKNLLNNNISEIDKKKESINKRIFNSLTKKYSLIDKEIDMESLTNPIKKKNITNKKINLTINKSESEISGISSINTTWRKNIFSYSTKSNNNYSLIKSKSNTNIINSLSPKNKNKKDFFNEGLKKKDSLNMKLNETFCYFKLIKDKDNIFNPLKHYQIPPDKLGYLQGYISINFENYLLEIKPKINEGEINIKMQILEDSFKINLKKINDIICEMNDVIKIHEIYLKYNEYCNLISLNKLINYREIRNIKMNNNDKIKSALCHFFSFLIVFNNKKRIECIFINYEDFIKWFQWVLIIVNDNKKHNKFESKNENLFYKIINKSKRRTQSLDMNSINKIKNKYDNNKNKKK